MTVAMVGMGWHSWLFREEMKALLGDISILHPRIVTYDIRQEEISKLSGASLLDEVLILGGHSISPNPQSRRILSARLSVNGPFRISRKAILLFVLGRLVSSLIPLVAGASKIKSEELFHPVE